MKQFFEKAAGWPVIRFFVNSTKVSALVLKTLLLLVIPYAYLMLCGLIFDRWLKLYMMTTFIFVSLCVLVVLALLFIVWAWIRHFGKSSTDERRC